MSSIAFPLLTLRFFEERQSGLSDVRLPGLRFVRVVLFDETFEIPLDPPTFRGRTRAGDEASCFIVGFLDWGEEARSGSGPGVGGSSERIFLTAHLRFSSSNLRRSVCNMSGFSLAQGQV